MHEENFTYYDMYGDISPLIKIENLSYLNLDAMSLEDEEVENLRSHLTKCTISFDKEEKQTGF